MAEIRFAEQAQISAAPQRVFSYRLDFTTLSEYNPNVTNVRRVDGGTEPGAGAHYEFDLTLGGATMPTSLRVLEATAPERIVVETGPGFLARETCTFDPSSEGTRVTFDTTLTFPGDVEASAAKAVEASGREQVRLELDLLKKHFES